MLNEQQIIDSTLCEKKQMNGEGMKCFECSCNVCIAQIHKDYKPGLKRATEIVEKEMKFAATVNPQMALGMSQVLMLFKKELEG